MDFPTSPLSQDFASNRCLVLAEGCRLRVEHDVDCFGDAETKVFERNSHGLTNRNAYVETVIGLGGLTDIGSVNARVYFQLPLCCLLNSVRHRFRDESLPLRHGTLCDADRARDSSTVIVKEGQDCGFMHNAEGTACWTT